MKKVLEALVALQVNLPVQTILLVLVISFIIAMIIYLTYKHTFSGVLYNDRFNISLVMITVITTMVMAVIGSNISVSLGMVGALSIVRFRTAIKDPRDTAFIFWCIVVGLACGTQNYYIALIGSLFISLILFLFKKYLRTDNKYILVVRGNNLDIEKIESIIKDNVDDFMCKGKYNNNEEYELIYDIKFSLKNKNRDIKSLNDVKGVNTVNIVQSGNDIMG